MKIFYTLVLTLSCLCTYAQVGIGTISPDPSSVLDITSTNAGMLVPRMLEADKNAIASPAKGLLIYQTDQTEGFYYYTGIEWLPFISMDNDWTIVGDKMYNANSGNVGIGVTAPSATLHIQSSGSGTAILNQDFETAIPPANTSGAAPWFIQTTVVQSGVSAGEAGNINDNETSSLTYTVNIPSGGGNLSFDYQTSCETNFDFFRFYLDGIELGEWTGTTAWSNFSTSITAGSHTLEWHYVKDAAFSSGDDTARLDNIQVTDNSGAVIRLIDGNEGDGKILTSDANGNASWKTLTETQDLNGFPDIITLKRLPIPVCNGAVIGDTSTASIVIDVKGVPTTVTWEIVDRTDRTGQTENVVRSINFVAQTVVKREVLKIGFTPEKLRVVYTFSPALPFEPDLGVYTAVNTFAPSLPDTFNITQKAKSSTSIDLIITRVDTFSGNDGSECWLGQFFIDGILAKE